MMAILWTTVVLAILVMEVRSCGVITHLEIVHRAATYFEGNSSITDFKQLFVKHRDAFQAGAAYPDAYYPDICFNGRYHDISEDTHWGPFLNATLRYLAEHYPPPWDDATEKLVAFVFSLVSHQVADTSWHSLGITQGFLQTMAKVNFLGSYTTGHPIGDLGGDILNQYELNTDYISASWYIPIHDLVDIYEEMYGEERITPEVVRTCTTLLFLSRIAEQLGGAELFPWFAAKSPFLLDRLDDYFLGGLDDMATWTSRIWTELIQAIQYGPGSCVIPERVLFMRCNDTSGRRRHGDPGRRPGAARQAMVPFKLDGLRSTDVRLTHTRRGVFIRPSQRLKRRMRLHRKTLAQARRSSRHGHTNDVTKYDAMTQEAIAMRPSATLYSSQAYSRLGRSVKAADVNGDGFPDLVIGAPGYGEMNSPQQGRVYLIMGGERGLPLAPGSNVDIDTVANITLNAPEKSGSRFGWSVEVLDVSGDQLADVVVSAPGSGSDQLRYQGKVYIYFNTGDSQQPVGDLPDLSISCSSLYCNHGYTIHSADMNRDGVDDLLIGSPFAGAGGEQRGIVSVLYGSHSLHGAGELSEVDMNETLRGNQDYEWFGYSMSTLVFGESVLLSVGAPTFRECSRRSCVYSSNDTQSVGRVYMYTSKSDGLVLSQVLTGNEEFGMLGSSLDMAWRDANSVYIVSGQPNTDVSGRVVGVPLRLRQVGSVSVLVVDVGEESGLGEVTRLTHFDGDRQFGRFGALVMFGDVDDDGEEDLLISAPRWTADITGEIYGEEEGVVYVFLSRAGSLPRGNVTRDCPLMALINPCPAHKADFRLILGEKESWFGMSMALLSHGNQVTVVTAAPHSSQGSARLGGSVVIHALTDNTHAHT